jgi:hypothetical protein
MVMKRPEPASDTPRQPTNAGLDHPQTDCTYLGPIDQANRSTEFAKSEILAFEGSTLAASARVEAAEKSDEKAYEMEGGGVTYTASKLRRRVKADEDARIIADAPGSGSAP